MHLPAIYLQDKALMLNKWPEKPILYIYGYYEEGRICIQFIK